MTHKLTAFAASVVISGLILLSGHAASAASATMVPGTTTTQGRQDVELTASATDFQPSILYDGGDFTSVQVRVTNNGSQNISVNPLFFTITATDGGKHNTTLGEDERQLDTLDLAPGEHVEGVITAEGAFQPARVSYEVDGFGETVTADVG